MTYTKKILLDLYKTMKEIRLCEESFIDPILNRDIQCPVHLYTGQEAVATGVCATLKKEDYVFGPHRSHGYYLAKGGSLKGLIAEVYCRETGCSKGRGGSMHIGDIQNGMIGSAPIVAGTISLAVGAALASTIRKDKRITVSFFGDGATGEGVLFESLNFAALNKLPIIFVCENNYYSTHLPVAEHRPDRKISDIAKPFDIKSYRIDGNNVLRAYECSLQATKLCRKGEGPVFIEFLTYRLCGHVGPFDNINGNHTDIRPTDEIERWKKKDPIRRFVNYLIKRKNFTSTELQKLDSDIEREIMRAHKFARNSNNPDNSGVMKYVFK